MPCNQFISVHVVSCHFVELVVRHDTHGLSVQMLLQRLVLHFHVNAALESTDPLVLVVVVHGSSDYTLRSTGHILMALV